MVIDGNRKPEKCLEDPVQVRGIEQVDSTNDIRDFLQPVVVNHREVVARPDILSHNHGITEQLGAGQLFTPVGILPREFPFDRRKSPAEVEAQGMGRTFRDPTAAFVFTERAAGAGIERPFRSVGCLSRSFDFPQDVFSSAEARVEEATSGEGFRRFRELGAVLALDPDGLFPLDSEPGEVFQDLRGVLGATTSEVDILDAEEKPSLP